MLNPEMKDYQKGLLERLYCFKNEVASARSGLIRIVFDNEYFRLVEEEIWTWCEENQNKRPLPGYSAIKGESFLLFSDHIVNPGEFKRFDAALSTLDRIKKKEALRNKVKLLAAENIIREQLQMIPSAVFELYVVARFAVDEKRVKLNDIDYKFTKDRGVNVDGLIEIDGEKILVEATYISKPLRESAPVLRDQVFRKTGVDLYVPTQIGVLNPDEMKARVYNKIHGKSEHMGMVGCPVILVVGLPPGPTPDTAELSVRKVFGEKTHSNISCVVISESYLLKSVKIYFNRNAAHPCPENTKSVLESLFTSTNCY